MADATTLRVVQGGDYTIPITVKDSAGNAIDITGHEIYFTVKNNPDDADSDAVISKNITSHTTPASGISELTLDHDDTDIAPGDYVYDFKRKDGSGNFVPYNDGTDHILPCFRVLRRSTTRESTGP